MNENEIIQEFGKMWTDELHDYALIKSDSHLDYTIMNTIYNVMVIIEDDNASRYVIKKMIENGVRISNNEDEVGNPNPPQPFVY